MRWWKGWLVRVASALALLAVLPVTTAAAEANAASPRRAADPASAEELAALEGRAERAAVAWVLANSGPLTGDYLLQGYRVAYTLTRAEGWWELAAEGKLAWHEPPPNSVHLRVFVLDARDGRLLNGLTVLATLTDPRGNESPVPVAFGWYPLVNAYGGNVALSGDGSYRLRVSIVAAPARSTGSSSGEAPSSEVAVQMTGVSFHPIDIEQNTLALLPVASETSFATQAKLLKPSNDALSAAMTALWQQSASGAEKSSGDYFVSYALGDSALSGPLSILRKGFGNRENMPLEVLVRDSRTGRLIPALAARAELISSAGATLDGGELAPIRRPLFNIVYARNLKLERKGSYKLRVRFDPPGFRRWGRQSERFAQPATVEFEDVSLPAAAQHE
jgi:Fe2+ transport protein